MGHDAAQHGQHDGRDHRLLVRIVKGELLDDQQAGHRRQLLNLLGYAVMVNSLAIARGRPAVPIAA